MTANAASPPVNSRPLVLDAETAEVKVESLWGMVDARAPPSLESSEMQSPEVSFWPFPPTRGERIFPINRWVLFSGSIIRASC